MDAATFSLRASCSAGASRGLALARIQIRTQVVAANPGHALHIKDSLRRDAAPLLDRGAGNAKLVGEPLLGPASAEVRFKWGHLAMNDSMAVVVTQAPLSRPQAPFVGAIYTSWMGREKVPPAGTMGRRLWEARQAKGLTQRQVAATPFVAW